MTMLGPLEETGVCSSTSRLSELGRGNGKVERDWRNEIIIEIRLVIELCISCGFEILVRTSESLSLRVPD